MSADVAAIILAAGRSTRFGAGPGESKVYALLAGRPLVAHVVAAARAGGAAPVIVVTGHAAHHAAAALRDEPPDVLLSHPDHASGMASSLRAGLAAVPETAGGALVMLADMPLVAPATLAALIRCFAAGRCDAVAPNFDGRRGNPVLLSRGLFGEIMGLTGDEGARRLLAQAGRRVLDCAVEDPGILADIDTREALERLRPR